MFKYFKKLNSQNDKLYNKILFLSRNKLFYTKFSLGDTFENRINLIFIHISFLFIKVKQKDGSHFYNEFYQQMFDLIFRRVEVNMRELGYSDTSVNKNMKILVKTFYNIGSWKQYKLFMSENIENNIERPTKTILTNQTYKPIAQNYIDDDETET